MSSAHILVVDDDDNLRWILQTQLEQMGHSVKTASDGVQALQAIESSVPSLVITDLKMPRISGMELLEKIRAAHPEVPVVIMTAFGTIQSAVGAMHLGACDYLTKPIDYDKLAFVVDRVLDGFKLIEEVRSDSVTARLP